MHVNREDANIAKQYRNLRMTHIPLHYITYNRLPDIQIRISHWETHCVEMVDLNK